MVKIYNFWHHCILPGQPRSAMKYCKLVYRFDDHVWRYCIICKPHQKYWFDRWGTLRSRKTGIAFVRYMLAVHKEKGRHVNMLLSERGPLQSEKGQFLAMQQMARQYTCGRSVAHSSPVKPRGRQKNSNGVPLPSRRGSARARVERRMQGYDANSVVSGRGANQDEAGPSNPANPGRNAAGPSSRRGSRARKATAKAVESRAQSRRAPAPTR